jgi:hypothetical protein
MNRNPFQTMIASLLIVMIISGCNPTPEKITQPPAAAPTPMVAKLIPNPKSGTLPLSAPGPYQIGMREYRYEDANREGRKVDITIWFPAIKPAGSAASNLVQDIKPDLTSAPYPLILSSTKVAKAFAPYLVSHGFVWASVNGIDTYSKLNEETIDQPLDILFTLNQVASNPPEEVVGIIKSEQVGVIGYSFDGYNTLALSGARIDPQYYLAQCPNPDATTKSLVETMYSAFGCGPAEDWDHFAVHAGESITTSGDGLWQPITDKRIRAVMPMAGEGWWFFGEKGLAEVKLPVLMIDGTKDGLYLENTLIYEYLGTSDKVFISFIGLDHMMVLSSDPVASMAHFAVAFFGYHLQGRKDYAVYFSKEFVTKYPDLVWGVVAKK